jgi:anti-anti-sigma factor
MPLEIQIKKGVDKQHPATLTVELTGSLDTVTSPDLERQLTPLLTAELKEVIFDLANLKFISSAGLRVIAAVRKRLKEQGGQLSCVHMQPQIQEVFDIIKALPGIKLFKDYAEMDAYLAARQRAHTEKQ